MVLTLGQEEFAAFLGLEYNPEEGSIDEILNGIDMLLRECFDLTLAGGAAPSEKITDFSQDQLDFLKMLDFDFDVDDVPASDLWNLVQMYVHDTYGVNVAFEVDAPAAEEPSPDQPDEDVVEELAVGAVASDNPMTWLGTRKPPTSVSEMMSHDII